MVVVSTRPSLLQLRGFLPIPCIQDNPNSPVQLPLKLRDIPLHTLLINPQLLRLANRRIQYMPTLHELRLALIPITRMQQALHIQQMRVPHGKSAVKIPGRRVVRLRELLRALTQVAGKLLLQVLGDVLGGAGADLQEETGPLEAEGPAGGAVIPPVVVFLEEGVGVDDVVVVVDVGNEVAD